MHTQCILQLKAIDQDHLNGPNLCQTGNWSESVQGTAGIDRCPKTFASKTLFSANKLRMTFPILTLKSKMSPGNSVQCVSVILGQFRTKQKLYSENQCLQEMRHLVFSAHSDQDPKIKNFRQFGVEMDWYLITNQKHLCMSSAQQDRSKEGNCIYIQDRVKIVKAKRFGPKANIISFFRNHSRR